MGDTTQTANTLATALSGIDLSIIGSTLTSVIGPCLAVIVPVMAIRKGISFVMGMIHGA